MLSRESILSGAYHEAFAHLPADILWPLEKIEASLAETLRSRPENGEIWLFGYGSLIWNPLFEYDARIVATLDGWHRSFCMRTTIGRGCVDAPGRMLSLESGGSTTGVALRMPKETADDELRLIWIREMVAGAYNPIWADLSLPDGRTVAALTFVANPVHCFYEANSGASHIAPLIAVASGPMGTNTEYITKLRKALHDCKISDNYIEELWSELERIAPASNT